MMADSIVPRKKFTNEEIISSLIFLGEVGKLNDAELKARGLQIGEAQKVNHFLTAVSMGESTCLTKQAETVLRLTPLLLERGSNTIHHIFSVAMPQALEAYQKTKDLGEKRALASAIKTAGMVCVNRRLGPVTRERRKAEFKMFEPFIGETPEFREAVAKFMRRTRPSERSLDDVARQPVNVVRPNPYGRRYTGRFGND